jgi:hypothetical protein
MQDIAAAHIEEQFAAVPTNGRDQLTQQRLQA